MVDKLEACPFCGGEASLTIPSEHVQADCADIYVSCDECEAEGQHVVVEIRDRTPDLWPYEQRDAIAAWNTRATPANGEQVERGDDEIISEFRFLYEQYGLCPDEQLAPDALELKAKVLAAVATPTEDARERVKVLEEALGNLLDFIGHKDMRVYATDLVVVEARAALGNKETDRHG